MKIFDCGSQNHVRIWVFGILHLTSRGMLQLNSTLSQSQILNYFNFKKGESTYCRLMVIIISRDISNGIFVLNLYLFKIGFSCNLNYSVTTFCFGHFSRCTIFLEYWILENIFNWMLEIQSQKQIRSYCYKFKINYSNMNHLYFLRNGTNVISN